MHAYILHIDVREFMEEYRFISRQADAFNIRPALSLLFPFPSVIFEKLIYGQ